MKAWVAVAITVACLLVTLGYNWRRVDEVAVVQAEQGQTISAMREAITKNDIWQQVSSAQQTTILKQLEEIRAIIAPRRIYSSSDTDPSANRRFDK